MRMREKRKPEITDLKPSRTPHIKDPPSKPASETFVRGPEIGRS